MIRTRRIDIISGLTIFVLGLVAGMASGGASLALAQSSDRVFELRTYTTHPGRLDALHDRFSQHTIRLFERHGMVNIGYFTPQDPPEAGNTLVYLLAHDSREAAAASWQAFIADPEWQAVYSESRADGPIVEKLDSVFMNPTAYSQVR
ncbi:MAG: NIPSNAP family protein [Gammaproteobacteria bacterium]|nr:NIPSNAP family protein [Gammaproteobacteria bacterium]